ncbi:MAG: outer membrane protein assembly factor BamD [Verrucomicrobiota bacterium]
MMRTLAIAGFVGISCALVLPVEGALVWRPGEGWTDESGTEISASSSKEQLAAAKRLEGEENYKGARKAYANLVRRWPLSFYAHEAQFGLARMEEKQGDFLQAYNSYQKLVEKYPNSVHFQEALDREMAIGNLYLGGEPKRLWRIPLGSDYGKAVEIFEQVVKNAPYGRNAPDAMFHIGLAFEKQGKFNEAVASYNRLIDKYPGSPLVDDAMYQIGFTWKLASKKPEYDQSAAQKAIEGFQDFMVRFPNSDKVVAAEEHVDSLTERRTEGAYEVAKFYEKQGNKKAAYIYYNEVVRTMPDSDVAKKAQEKISELREAVEGEQAVQNAKKAKPVTSSEGPSLSSNPADQL